MTTKTNPFDFIDTVIDPIPVVGQIWADAMYTMLGLSDAYNQRKFGLEQPPFPPRNNVVGIPAKATAEQLQRAA